MISRISIKNFAIIKTLDVEFGEGLNIITGETGAGKSVIIEAIHMALGGRADTSYVRTGCDRAVIQLVLTPESSCTNNVVQIECEEPVIITREILANGRSTGRINDEIVTLAKLSSFCRQYADIHGQYDNQALLNPENHIDILDSFDPKGRTAAAKEAYSALYDEYSVQLAKLGRLKKTISEGRRKKDFLEYELKEINGANLRQGEDDEIAEQLSVLQNREKILSAASSAGSLLYSGETNCSSLIENALNELRKIASISKEFSDMQTALEECSYTIHDISGSLNAYTDAGDFSPAEIDSLIERQELIEGLKRKYNCSLDEVIAHRDRIAEELSNIDNHDEVLKELTESLLNTYKRLAVLADDLSAARKEAALEMEAAVNSELLELSFKNSVFKVNFDTRLNSKGGRDFTADGTDIIEFFISTNKGESLKPLAKIASGGEISRIMLAFKRITGDYSMVPTFIFDEIDAGISGNAATVVGRKLMQISEKHQVICITHLPQIAVMGRNHYMINKSSDDRETFSSITRMNDEELVREIARLTGSGLTEKNLESAREMIEMASKH